MPNTRLRPAAALAALSLLLAPTGFAQAGTVQVGADQGEPLPSGAPTDPYELSAWCYGAMSEYLAVYDEVKPDIRAIDKLFGSSVLNEKEPYRADITAARDELKVLAGAVEAAEKASPQVIAPRGVEAVKTGRAIWGPAETGTHRELARAWMSWALPDRCDSNARELSAKSALLGQVLKYNAPSATDAPADPAPAAVTPAATPAVTPVAEPAPAQSGESKPGTAPGDPAAPQTDMSKYAAPPAPADQPAPQPSAGQP